MELKRQFSSDDLIGLNDNRTTYSESNKLSKKDVEEPEDKGGVVNFIFLLWGFGTLLPWNAVLSCFDFFTDEMTGYQPAFIFPLAVNGLLSVTQVCMIIYGSKLSDRFKVQLQFIFASLIIFSLPLLAHFLGSSDAKFYSCFCALLLFGLSGGILQSQVFGLAGILPGKYTGAIMFGQGLSGILMNLLRLVFVLTLPSNSLYLQAQIFFTLSGFALLGCAYSFTILMRNPFFLFYKQQANFA